MNFLSSAISSLTGTSIPYTFKDKIIDPLKATYPDSRSIWTVYNGLNPKTDTPVTIFEFNLKDPAATRWNYDSLARNCFKKSKLIKFPGIVSIVDYFESESYLYIVTEHVTPLQHYLNTHSDKITKETKLYGVYNVAHALSFINTKAYSVHGHLDLSSSVFVNAQGEWKLFGFELLTSMKSDPDQPIYRLSSSCPMFNENLPDEVVKNGIEAIRPHPFKFDSYKLGVFIFTLLAATSYNDPVVASNGEVFAGSSQIPRSLVQPVKKLTNVKPNLRITVEKFLQETETYFGSNRLVSFSRLLEDMKFQNAHEKLAFFKNDVAQYIDEEFPPGYLDNKLLPEIITQYNNLVNTKPAASATAEQQQYRQETISVLLNYILKLGTGLSDDGFSKTVKPIIFHAFTLPDRAIRLTLLNYLPKYAHALTDSEVQSKLFYSLITGFHDTNFMIRETTLKSFTSIIDKVSVKQINQEMLKVLAKSQMDPKPSIRTNTLILIIKVSSKIYANSKNSVIITALGKSLRDSFVPCKIMALSGFEQLRTEFSLEEICSKVLGHLAIALMDSKSFKVREEAKRVFQLYLTSVEEHAASLPKDEEDEDEEEKEFFRQHAPSAPAESKKEVETSSSTSFGWSMVNKLVSSSAIGGDLNKSFNSSTPDLTREPTPVETTRPAQSFGSTARINSGSRIEINANSLAADEDGWDVENDSDEGFGEPVVESKPLIGRNGNTRGRITPARTPGAGAGIAARKTDNAARTKPGLTLGAKKPAAKSPGSTLKLDLKVDEDEDSWDGDW
ncbi:hypothetical protein FT663_04175 [Candidozyma haemuli var. vulneris]|uniref:Protein kinase domain-containing protein n=1 Tax=Candidozyma haemuli TaxID=45357 RepID=A0A2V1B2V2_9ASCO|nr:hypothetical protein CXQ85_004145 [[Candida] haemuloni]KAF3985773.1 hypothetical protein FT662_04950 [[Candida] haemuloni var. vulneris]KAF3988110.1 hypothetical protein FT663_04175 [[Candida] haemuloni var. vulneris]PVH23851.1 hypothetical protein CXQ85_004145 [[Candida] haemuloni]